MSKNEIRKRRVALLGQPNAGKSTLFNRLTGMHQHVGNWPGKTVARKSGQFARHGTEYILTDLPGTYSLTPGSDEETITHDYLLSGKADAVVIVLDASQLERSLYLLSEYIGVKTPLVVALNMMDVARDQGKTIDHKAIEKKLGCPVIPTVAAKGRGLDSLVEAVDKVVCEKRVPESTSLAALYEEDPELPFREMEHLLSGIRSTMCTPGWWAEKLISGSPHAKSIAKEHLPEEDWKAICRALAAPQADSAKVRVASHKYAWIAGLTDQSVTNPEDRHGLTGFDRFALHPFWGKMIAVMAIFLGVATSLLVVSPLFLVTAQIPVLAGLITDLLHSMGAPDIVISFFADGLMPAVMVTFILVACIAGFVFVLTMLEDIGYLARIAFIFDRTMSRLGMHGKSFMPIIMGFSCNIAGVTGSRIIDTWKQRTLTAIVSLITPCLAVWGVIFLLSGIFFGEYFMLILIALFATGVLHMAVTAKLFGRLLGIDSKEPGLIMELPPYHKPNFATIFSRMYRTARGILIKSMALLISVSLVIWALSYSPDGNIQTTVLYTMGKAIEPFGLFFGMDWRLFITLLLSAIRKEAALGVIAILFNPGQGQYAELLDGTLSYDIGTVSQALIGPEGTSAPMALAFMFAFFLNLPCLAAIAAVRIETQSLKWTAVTVGYYLGFALIVSGIVYRVSSLFL